jgi:DivIVA domain-containing protein
MAAPSVNTIGACHPPVAVAWHHRGVLVLGIVVAAAVVFAVFAVAAGRGGSMTMFEPDRPGRSLPADRAVRAPDVAAARFSLAFRGYRMIEVDDALDRLALEIAERDLRIEQLTGRPFELQAPISDVSADSGGGTPQATPAEESVDPLDETVELPAAADSGDAHDRDAHDRDADADAGR